MDAIDEIRRRIVLKEQAVQLLLEEIQELKERLSAEKGGKK